MKQFSIFEGKNKFSQLVSDAAKGDPQIVTKNGTPTAVVISFAEYKKLTGQVGTLGDFLLNSPLRGIGDGLDLTRNKDLGRPTIDFGEPDLRTEED